MANLTVSIKNNNKNSNINSNTNQEPTHKYRILIQGSNNTKMIANIDIIVMPPGLKDGVQYHRMRKSDTTRKVSSTNVNCVTSSQFMRMMIKFA